MARRLGIAVFGAVGLLLAALIAVARTAPPAAPRPADPHATSQHIYVGAPSCAAAGCHNGNDFDHVAGSEYSIWSGRDPHGRAFAVLSQERSQKIMKAYRDGADARKDTTCRVCHSLPTDLDGAAPPSADLVGDGVSCEACHGPASAWLDAHTTSAWRGLSAKAKEDQGFLPTRDLARRIERCADCHVGRPGAEVDHDLIAAGHPRLAFEYAAYHELLPRHWKEKDYGPDFSARAWAVGQTKAEQAETAVIQARGRPDFSDYDCFACHHDLGQPSWRQQRGYAGKPGQPVPGTWYAAPAFLAEKDAIDPEPMKPERLKALLLRVTKPDAEGDGPPTWDRAAQTYLAVAALNQALTATNHAAPPGSADALWKLRETVKFPPTKGEVFDSPRDFKPLFFRNALKDVRATFGG